MWNYENTPPAPKPANEQDLGLVCLKTYEHVFFNMCKKYIFMSNLTKNVELFGDLYKFDELRLTLDVFKC